MIIPVGFCQFNVLFGGPGLPTGAEVTFAAEVNTVLFSPLDYAGSITTKWAAHILPEQSESVTLLGCLCKFGPNLTGPSATFGTAQDGLVATEATSPAVAALVRKVTGIGGRRGRGRMFVLGVPEAEIDPAGEFSPAQLLSWQSSFEDFFDAMVTDNISPVLLHADSGHVPVELTGFSVASTVATQRRRQRR